MVYIFLSLFMFLINVYGLAVAIYRINMKMIKFTSLAVVFSLGVVIWAIIKVLI